LLIEESRTNIVTGVGGATNAILTSGQFNELTGNNDAYLYQKNASSSVESQIAIPVSGSVSTTSFTYSAFVKPGTSNKIYFQTVANNLSDNAYHYFSIGDNSSVSVDYASSGNLTYTRTITPLHSGWYRLSVTIFGFSDTSLYLSQVRIGSFAGTTTHPYTNTTDTFYFYGAQVEVGSFPTSYIPTSGSAVTRVYDNAQILGANFSNSFNTLEGTFVAECDRGNDGTEGAGIGTMRATADSYINMIQFGEFYDNSGYLARVYVGGGAEVFLGATHTTGQGVYNRYSFAYKTNSFAGAINGVLQSEDTTGALPTGLDRFLFGRYNNDAATQNLDGHIKKLSYYPQRLTNDQLQNLTK